METTFGIRHRATDRYLGSGGTWVPRAEALVLTAGQARTWIAAACESRGFETVQVAPAASSAEFAAA